MAAVIGSLRAELSASIARFEADMKRASGSVKGLEGSFKRLGSVTRVLSLTALAGGLTAVSKKALNTADELVKASDRAGVAFASFQKLAFAADLAGVSTEDLEKSLFKLGRALGELAAGKKNTLGDIVNARDVAGNVRKIEDVLSELADKYVKAGSAAERFRIVNDAFGRSGQRLVPLLQGGGEAARKLGEAFSAKGGVLSEESARKAEEMNDRMRTMSLLIQRNLARAVLEHVGSIESLVGAFEDLTIGATNAFFAIGRFVGLLEKSPDVSEIEKAIVEMETSTIEQINAAIDRAIFGDNGPWAQRLAKLKARRAELEAAVTAGAKPAVSDDVSNDLIDQSDKAEKAKQKYEEMRASLIDNIENIIGLGVSGDRTFTKLKLGALGFNDIQIKNVIGIENLIAALEAGEKAAEDLKGTTESIMGAALSGPAQSLVDLAKKQATLSAEIDKEIRATDQASLSTEERNKVQARLGQQIDALSKSEQAYSQAVKQLNTDLGRSNEQLRDRAAAADLLNQKLRLEIDGSDEAKRKIVALETARNLDIIARERQNDLSELTEQLQVAEREGNAAVIASLKETIALRGQYFDALSAATSLTPELERQKEKADELRESFRDFSHVIGTAFEDAIIEGGKFSDLLKGLEKDILRILARVLVTKPLENALMGALGSSGLAGGGGLLSGGGLLGSLLSGGASGGQGMAFGAAGGAGTLLGFAEGGAFNVGQRGAPGRKLRSGTDGHLVQFWANKGEHVFIVPEGKRPRRGRGMSGPGGLRRFQFGGDVTGGRDAMTGSDTAAAMSAGFSSAFSKNDLFAPGTFFSQARDRARSKQASTPSLPSPAVAPAPSFSMPSMTSFSAPTAPSFSESLSPNDVGGMIGRGVDFSEAGHPNVDAPSFGGRGGDSGGGTSAGEGLGGPGTGSGHGVGGSAESTGTGGWADGGSFRVDSRTGVPNRNGRDDRRIGLDVQTGEDVMVRPRGARGGGSGISVGAIVVNVRGPMSDDQARRTGSQAARAALSTLQRAAARQ